MSNNKYKFGAIIAGGGSILLGIVVGILLLTCVYALPTEPMRRNARVGFENYETEGEHYNLVAGFDMVGMDGFTDSIMIGNAVHAGTGNPLRDALINNRLEFEGHNKVESLSAALNGEAGGKDEAYPRYWHGYLIFLKPLLSVFSLAEIRMLNMGVQMAAMVMVLLLAYHAGGVRLTVPFGAAVLLLNPVSTALSFQLTDMYLLLLFFSAWMMGAKTYEKSWGWMLYLWLGILTAYFDFLTCPPMALGILLLLELLLTEDSPKGAMKKVVLRSVAWVCGYGGMWAGKWICATVLTGQNVIGNAMIAAEEKTSTIVSGRKVNVLQVIWHNVRLYFNPYVAVVSLCLIVVLMYYCMKKGLRLSLKIPQSLPYAFVGLYPFVWYCCLKSHSIIHPFMEHKNLTISAMALICIVIVNLRSGMLEKKQGAAEPQNE